MKNPERKPDHVNNPVDLENGGLLVVRSEKTRRQGVELLCGWRLFQEPRAETMQRFEESHASHPPFHTSPVRVLFREYKNPFF